MFPLLVIYLCLNFTLLYLLLTGNKLQAHDGCMFSTGSIDNDLLPSRQLAKELKAPWWYCRYFKVILTGQYGEKIISGPGIKWKAPWNERHFAKFAVMMIRPN